MNLETFNEMYYASLVKSKVETHEFEKFTLYDELPDSIFEESDFEYQIFERANNELVKVVNNKAEVIQWYETTEAPLHGWVIVVNVEASTKKEAMEKLMQHGWTSEPVATDKWDID